MPIETENLINTETVETEELTDTEFGVTKTSNLKSQDEQIERISNRVARLQGDIDQRTANCEANLRMLSGLRDGEIQQSRDDYARSLSRGDSVGLGKSLDRIRKCQKELEGLARQVRKSNLDDECDLTARQIELSREAGPLLAMTKENLALAQNLDLKVRRLFIQLNESVGRNIRRLKSVFDESSKIAGEILSGDSEKP